MSHSSKGAFIQQQLQPLARRQLAFAVLRVYALLAAAEAGRGAFLFELFEDFLHGVFRNVDSETYLVESNKRRAAAWLMRRESCPTPGTVTRSQARGAQLLRLRLGLRKKVAAALKAVRTPCAVACLALGRLAASVCVSASPSSTTSLRAKTCLSLSGLTMLSSSA
jgi:hypothetical protein